MGGLITDTELWESLKDGDKGAFTTLYNRYSKMLYSYGLRLIQNEDIVAEALQLTFIKFWNKHKTITSPTQVKFFIIASFRNNLLRLIKKEKRTEPIDNFDEENFVMDFTLESDYIKIEDLNLQSKKLNDALNRLSSRQKEVIYLRYFEELDYNEISKIMNISVKGAYKLSARAILSLQTILKLSRSGLLFLLTVCRVSSL